MIEVSTTDILAEISKILLMLKGQSSVKHMNPYGRGSQPQYLSEYPKNFWNRLR